MADDHNQRPYRGNEAPARGPASNDPLAELARLIGQNDPFSEFGGKRDAGTAGRRAAPQPQDAPEAGWAPQAAPRAAAAPEALAPAMPRSAAAPAYQAPDFGRQTYGGGPIAAGADVYQVDNQGYDAPPYQSERYDAPGYGAPGYQAQGFPAEGHDAAYDPHPFPQDRGPRGDDDIDGEEYYDDVPPKSRRFGIVAIAGVFALAVIGTAGAFGYRAIFGSNSVSGPPPVIRADATPSKIVPAGAAKDAPSGKAITDRANDQGQGERLVSREEQPLPVTPEQPVNSAYASNQAAAPYAATPGVVGAEPKKIRTVAIRPDGSTEPQADPAAAAPVAQAAEPAPVAPQPVQRVTAAPRQTAPRQIEQRPVEPRPEPPRQAEAPAPANAPLSLNPDAGPPRGAEPVAPQRTAAAAAPVRSAPVAGGYAVQVSARKSEQDAQAAFQTLQAQFPDQLGGRSSMIKRVDLGAKGIYFRAMVGPFGSSGEATALCASLKSAGGQCIVQHN